MIIGLIFHFCENFKYSKRKVRQKGKTWYLDMSFGILLSRWSVYLVSLFGIRVIFLFGIDTKGHRNAVKSVI